MRKEKFNVPFDAQQENNNINSDNTGYERPAQPGMNTRYGGTVRPGERIPQGQQGFQNQRIYQGQRYPGTAVPYGQAARAQSLACARTGSRDNALIVKVLITILIIVSMIFAFLAFTMYHKNALAMEQAAKNKTQAEQTSTTKEKTVSSSGSTKDSAIQSEQQTSSGNQSAQSDNSENQNTQPDYSDGQNDQNTQSDYSAPDTEAQNNEPIRVYSKNKDPFYNGDYEHYPEDFVFVDSSTRYLDREEVESLTDDELRTAINEIYARHGYIFEKSPYKEQFGQYIDHWFEPTFKDVALTDNPDAWQNVYEDANLYLMDQVEKQRNNNKELEKMIGPNTDLD